MIATLVVSALAVTAFPGAANPVVALQDCHVAQDHTRAFTYATSPVTTRDVPAGQDVLSSYRSNLATFAPKSGGTWSSRTATVRFAGGGDQLLNLKLAFKGQTPARVRRHLAVTLTRAQGATIGTRVARAER